MRDAFGGVFTMRLMLVFIVVFVGFSAISLNYAKAFRIKNSIIDVIEQNQLANINDILTSTNPNYKTKINTIVSNADYHVDCDEQYLIDKSTGIVNGICYDGIVIKVNNERNDNNNIYYDVITYGGWDLGVLNLLLALSDEDPNSEEPMRGRWSVTGKAKVARR